jgi:DNA-binding beta-propeller fold protein YncE
VSSTGQLVVVEYKGHRAAIMSTDSVVRVNLTLPGAERLRRLARRGDVLFMTDSRKDFIHAVQENNIYIKAIPTLLSRIRALDITGATMWVTTKEEGVYRLTINKTYDVIDTDLFIADNFYIDFDYPRSITVQGGRVTVLCRSSNNVHVFNTVGTHLVITGFGDGGLNCPQDVVTDTEGFIYVADYLNRRIVRYDPNGEFLDNLVTQSDGMGPGRPASLYLFRDILYVVTDNPDQLHVIHLHSIL